jgi:hypothetical protein
MYARPRRDERLGERRSAPEPEPVPQERLLALQRSAGNAAVARALSTAPARTIARTKIDWGGDDLTKLLHIMPWKHGWDELIDAELAMMNPETGKLRSEDKAQLDEDEAELLKADYGRAREWMEIVLREKAGRKRTAVTKTGEIWQFKKEFPKEQTRRKVKALTVFVTGFRPMKDGLLEDRYIVGDAWVETDRQDYLKKHGWNAKGYVAPQPVGVEGT